MPGTSGRVDLVADGVPGAVQVVELVDLDARG